MKDVTTRPAAATDRDSVWQLNVLCYQDVVVRQFGQWDTDWQEANFDKKWASQDFTVILFDNKPIGILSASSQDNSLFLNEILIHPEYQNQGIGTAMLKQIMSTCDGPIRLQVLKKNRAVSLYQRLGFNVYNTTETHNQLEWKKG